jgi:hypothetical protein
MRKVDGHARSVYNIIESKLQKRNDSGSGAGRGLITLPLSQQGLLSKEGTRAGRYHL